MITKEVSIKQIRKPNKRNKKITPRQDNAIRTSRLTDDMVSENWEVLEQCRQYWDSLADFRYRRKRSRKYHRGDQWHELVEDEDGNVVTEETYIKDRGKIPFKQNMIRQLIRSLLGQYRTALSKSMVIARKKGDAKRSEMLTNSLQTAQKINVTKELDARNLEEFLLSGSVIGKTKYSFWKEYNREDVFTENINPNTIFFNTDVRDPRMTDLRLIGEVKDTTLDNIISSFASNEADAQKIRGWYTNTDPKHIVINTHGLTPRRMDQIDFYNASDTNKARVIEVWELASEWRTWAHDYLDGTYEITDLGLKEIEAINNQRIEVGIANGMEMDDIDLIDAERKLDQFWTVKFLTPYGQCLYQGETIYEHQSHPYTMVLHPLIDGEVWGLVEDIIDQQRSINRLISLLDFIMGSSAKGVLLVPEDAIPDDMDINDFTDEWTKMNGVIKLKKGTREFPKQVSSQAVNIGAQEQLAMQMKLIQDIAGVSSAIQGQQAKSGTPSSLYAQEAMNSTVNTKDLFESFAWYKEQRDTKMLKVIQQFYDDNRYIDISGNRYAEEAAYYDKNLVKDIDFDMVISEGIDSPVYRQIIDDQLVNLLDKQVIDGKMYLENSSMPFADKLLEALNNRDASAMPQEAQEMAAQADPQKMAMLNQMMANDAA